MIRQKRWLLFSIVVGLLIVGGGGLYLLSFKPSVSPQATAQQPTTPPSAIEGYIGTIVISPGGGPVGTTVQVDGQGFQPGDQLDILWYTWDSDWKLDYQDGEYTGDFLGISVKVSSYPIAAVTVDTSGEFRATFVVPEDYGGVHDVFVSKNGNSINKTAFRVMPTATMTPEAGPVGTPVTIEIKGINPVHPIENWYMLVYDNRPTGFISAIRTRGTARLTIPATGGPGVHFVEILNGAFGAPYLPLATSPYAYVPTFKFPFTITEGTPVLPPPAEIQAAPPVTATEPSGSGPAIWIDPQEATVGTPAKIYGRGLPAGKTLELIFENRVGSRVTPSGFTETTESLGQVTVGADGTFIYELTVSDHLGGIHKIEARLNEQVLAKTFVKTRPTPISFGPTRVKVGETITLHMKGIGWTQTENIFAVVYDNAYLGYACGFSTDGDVVVKLTATGTPGWHFVDLYPSFYRNKEYSKGMEQPFPYRHAIVNWQDHPSPMVFRFAFEIIADK
jgi:hypothetical protein